MGKLILLIIINGALVTNRFQKSFLWENVTESLQINEYIKGSTPVLFFKHSSKCGLSTMVLEEFEKEWNAPLSQCKIVFIDILNNRDVSNHLSDISGVRHHSPQVIVFKNELIIYNETHGRIKVCDVERALKTN